MSNYNKTYVLTTDMTLHTWSQSNSVCVPCNQTLFNLKLVRSASQPLNSVEWMTARPSKADSGELFMAVAKVNFSRRYSKTERKANWHPRAKTKEEALALFCEKAGLEKVGTISVDAVRDVAIHGHTEVNTFVIQGCFKVVDADLFQRAYNGGVGNRKTYGCGLIVVI